LIDVLCECEDALFPLCCEALNTDGQQLIVDNYLRRNDAASLQQPGKNIDVALGLYTAYHHGHLRIVKLDRK